MLLAALLASFLLRGSFQQLGFSVFDHLQKVFVLTEPDDVAMVFVNQESLDLLNKNEGLTFPLPRQVYGAIGLVAKEFEAKALVFDIIFSEPSRHGVEDDIGFAELLNQSGLPIFMSSQSQKGTVKKPAPILLKSIDHLRFGGLHVSNEVDGVFRRVPDTLPGEKGPVLSLAESVRKEIFSKKNKTSKEWLQFYDLKKVPWIPFYNVLIAYRSFIEGNTLSDDVLQSLNSMKGKVWIVGYSAPGLNDLKPTSIDPEAPGAFIHATALMNRLQNRGLNSLSLYSEMMISLVILLLITFVLGRFKTPAPAAGGAFGLLVILMTLIELLLWKMGFWWNPFPVLVVTSIYLLSLLTWKYQVQWKDRLKLAKTLEASMSPDMVGLIRSGEVKVSRFGQDAEISLLFSDLAGFTSLSEKVSARELVDLLNEYLDLMVEDILEFRGYVDKFIGDAIMAFWGAPVPEKNHAVLAVQSAAKMLNSVEALNSRLIEKGVESELRCRIGVHTGHVIVGNMGAKKRHNYTAIGDSVNLAARLESLCKKYSLYLLISEDTVHQMKSQCEAQLLEHLIEIDQVIVKGRTQSTKVYTVVDENHLAEAKIYESALKEYYQGRWSEALAQFELCKELPVAGVMKKRCQTAIASGTPELWQQGVWVHDSK